MDKKTVNSSDRKLSINGEIKKMNAMSTQNNRIYNRKRRSLYSTSKRKSYYVEKSIKEYFEDKK